MRNTKQTEHFGSFDQVHVNQSFLNGIEIKDLGGEEDPPPLRAGRGCPASRGGARGNGGPWGSKSYPQNIAVGNVSQ